LERLRESRAGQYRIGIDRQYRIGYVRVEGHSYEVEIADYHEFGRAEATAEAPVGASRGALKPTTGEPESERGCMAVGG
jgi:hypothetical protein